MAPQIQNGSAGAKKAKIAPTHELTIVAEWIDGQPITASVEVPYENPEPGPRGYRVHVVDFDATMDRWRRPVRLPVQVAKKPDVEDAALHAQNVYAIVMRTLARFEFALGRNVAWSFQGGHQISIAPHAFQGVNAFYSRRERGLFFGYTYDGTKNLYTCLSHDVVAHETTHALLDGLREAYLYASIPEQAAFHEGFADIVSLLSIFSIKEVVDAALARFRAQKRGTLNKTERMTERSGAPVIDRREFTADAIRDSAFGGLADGLGERGAALRRSAALSPQEARQSTEPHRMGELLVAAMMNTFIEVWRARSESLSRGSNLLDQGRIAEEGATAAAHLLTMAIRALDYAPGAEITFADYLSALLTADYEVQVDDNKYHYRELLRKSFAAYGVHATETKGLEPNIWEMPKLPLDYRYTHFEALQRDKDAMFRFIWQNRAALEIRPEAYTQVRSLRPCVRLSSDGFTVRETVAEYVEMVRIRADELRGYAIAKPEHMPDDQMVTLFGGGVLIFDEYGRVKYHIKQSIKNAARQERFLNHLWSTGAYTEKTQANKGFAAIHRARFLGAPVSREDEYGYF
jgi:hypothetical protein